MSALRTSILLAPLLVLAPPAFAQAKDEPDPELRAVDVLPDEMLRHETTKSEARVPFGLTAGLAGTMHFDRGEGGSGSMDLWIGLRFPRLVASTPFISFGSEVGFRDHPREIEHDLEYVEDDIASDSYTQLVPEMRMGFVAIDPSLGTAAQVFQIYSITGYRIPNRYDPAAIRLGAGVSSTLPLAVLGALKIPVPLPTTLEVLVDLPAREKTEVMLRVGFVF